MEIKRAIEILEYSKGYEGMNFGAPKIALDMEIKALILQNPVKPIYSEYDDNGFGESIPYKAECPTCGYEFEFGAWNYEENHHCICGQKMKWG